MQYDDPFCIALTVFKIKVLTVNVYNSINNISTKHTTQIIEHNKKNLQHIMVDSNPDSGLGHTQRCRGIKPDIGSQPFLS